jgi:hypothetical protein
MPKLAKTRFYILFGVYGILSAKNKRGARVNSKEISAILFSVWCVWHT